MADIFLSDEGPRIPSESKPLGSKEAFAKGGKTDNPKEPIDKPLDIASFSNPLSAFNFRPSKMKFETQESDEEIIVLLRKHPLTNLNWVLIAILGIIMPSFFGYLPFFVTAPSGFKVIIVLAWYMFTLAFALQKFLLWFFNVMIVTNRRVVDIDFLNMVYKEVSDTELEKVVDVTLKMGGVFRTMFDYGDVLIQTAGEAPNFEFLAVPRPSKVAKILQDLRFEDNREREKK